MEYFKKSQLLCVALVSLGTAYAQSVVISGGNIQVDASSSPKPSVIVNANPNGTARVSKSKVVVGGSDVIVVNGEKKPNGVTVNSGGITTKNSTSQRAVVSGGAQTTAITVRDRSVVDSGNKIFVNSDFSGQDLSLAKYAGASFTNVEAVGTNFKGVDLSKAVMTNVDLSKADLRGANLTGAQMTNVEWNGALLEGAIWVDGRRCAGGSVGRCR